MGTNKTLTRCELEIVCERVGLKSAIARKFAEEVFDKLGLQMNSTISFNSLITLIQQDQSIENYNIDCNRSGEMFINTIQKSSNFEGHVASGLLLLHFMCKHSHF